MEMYYAIFSLIFGGKVYEIITDGLPIERSGFSNHYAFRHCLLAYDRYNMKVYCGKCPVRRSSMQYKILHTKSFSIHDMVYTFLFSSQDMEYELDGVVYKVPHVSLIRSFECCLCDVLHSYNLVNIYKRVKYEVSLYFNKPFYDIDMSHDLWYMTDLITEGKINISRVEYLKVMDVLRDASRMYKALCNELMNRSDLMTWIRNSFTRKAIQR